VRQAKLDDLQNRLGFLVDDESSLLYTFSRPLL